MFKPNLVLKTQVWTDLERLYNYDRLRDFIVSFDLV